MGRLVIDASMTLAWILQDEETPGVDVVLEQVAEPDALVPSLWWFEVVNSLIAAERRGRISAAQRGAALADLEVIGTRNVSGRAFQALSDLAVAHGLTVYDASYLDVAMSAGAPLASLDRPLINAAQRAGISIIGERSSLERD